MLFPRSLALALALAASRASLTTATRSAAGVPCSSSSALTYLPGRSLEYGEINDGGDMHFYECEKTVTLHLEGEKGSETSGTKGREAAGTVGEIEGGEGESGSGRFYEFSLFGAADNAAAMEAAREFIRKHSFDGRDDPACVIAADTTTASSSSKNKSSSSASSNALAATAAAAAADVCLSRRIVEAARSSPGGGRRVPIRSPRWRVQDTFLFLPHQTFSTSSSASASTSTTLLFPIIHFSISRYFT